ncbi:MAG: hypothetical protein B6D35_05565 [Candidatus Brocadia sp. UTAMX2]|jgi:hypothetical protein|nr:MAG: hypothetical protein B6D35_05565 [Candidatus Brocadia sp. UTAMX2]
MDDRDDYTEVWLEDMDEGFDNSYYETIRNVLAPEYRDLDPEDINALLEDVFSGMSPEEIESFWGTLGKIGKSVAGVASKVLPVAAPVLGTALGGPVGGAIGGAVGKLAGKALGGAPGKPIGGQLSQVLGGGSPAVSQLMSFLQNPALLQSILGQVLGKAGRGTVPVGQQGASAPFGSFMNALSTLANQAAAEANAREDSQGTPSYLLDKQGNFLCDPAVPEERAQILLEQLHEDYPAETDDDEGESLTEWLSEAGLLENRPRSRRRYRSAFRRYPRSRYRRYRGRY